MEGEQRSSCGRYVSEEIHVTSEQAALAEMAYHLGSSNVIGEHEDDGNTRREASLLMSLSAFPESPDQSDLDLLSSSESEVSYMSDSSRSYENFSFVCPSLSLEQGKKISSLQHAYREKRNLARRCEKPTSKAAESSPTPANLFGRPLKSDDRDAVRLSADAMARNVYDSFRKALQWRITAWVEALSKSLARKEAAMTKNGATKDDLKHLLRSSEAALILNLRSIEDRIKVIGTRTGFTVLPQRINEKGEPRQKKQRLENRQQQLEEGEYQYSVAHAMRFECSVDLNTPAGYSEVSLEVPGTMSGTFLSAGFDQEEMTAVSLDINTDMLAVMIEKSCRKIVRASLEESMKGIKQEAPKEETTCTDKRVTFAKQQSPKPSPAKTLISEFSTPPPSSAAVVATPEMVRAALVSPQVSESSISSSSSPSSFLSPIPDDFDCVTPRRISPQPRSGVNRALFNNSATPRTPKTPAGTTAHPVAMLVSPPPSAMQNTEYQDAVTSKKKKGPTPSLPMLVEAAAFV